VVVGLWPIEDNGAVAADEGRSGAFRGASFTGADFTGAKFRDCDLRQVKITDSWLVDVRMSGLVGSFVVNDVDVTAFVEGAQAPRPVGWLGEDCVGGRERCRDMVQ
jgi:Pentapeptide repeats (8 copies)